MADNITITEGLGKTVATDDIQVDGSHAQGQVQFVKVVDGTLNGIASIAADIGTKANALRTVPANDITDATYIGDIKFGEAEPNSAAIKTAVEAIQTAAEIIDNAISGSEMQVDLVATNRANAVEAITDWTAVAQNAVGESGTIDCSGHDGTSLAIQAFLDTTTAHTGTRFIVQVSSNASGDEDWQDYREFIVLVGTATTDLIEDNPLSASSTSLTLTGHALTVEAIWIGIEDGTLINSELIFVASQSANAVVALDPTTNEHAQNTAVFNIAISKVLILDATVQRARVIIDNTYDNNGSTLNYKVRATKLTR